MGNLSSRFKASTTKSENSSTSSVSHIPSASFVRAVTRARALRTEFRWKIVGFMDFPTQVGYRITSPSFPGLGRNWNIVLYPNGENADCEHFIGVYLFLEDTEIDKSIIEVGCEFELIKLVGGDTGFVRKWHDLHKLNANDPSYGFNKFTMRSNVTNVDNGFMHNGDIEIRVTVSTYLLPDNHLSQTSSRQKEICDELEEMTVKIPLKHQKYMQDMFINGKFCDVVLVCSDKKEIKAHRCILAAHSEVFEKMMITPMSEVDHKRINLEFPSKVVLELLKFLYSGSCCPDHIEEDLFKISHLFGISTLMEACEKMMIDNLNMENSMKSLWFAKHYNIALLYEAAADLISFNVVEAKLSKDFQTYIEPDVELLRDLYSRVSYLNKGKSPELKRKSRSDTLNPESIKRLCTFDVRQELEKRGISPIGLREDLIQQLEESVSVRSDLQSPISNPLSESETIRGLDEED
jgi:speckle-type POZ protein